MAVDRELWWSVRWPWIVLWGATAVAVLVAVVAFVIAWRGRHRFTPKRRVPDLTFYLDGKSIMDLYQSGGYGDALQREVQERVGSSNTKTIRFKVPDAVEAGGDRQSGREVISRYIRTESPIAVIGVLLSVLEAADGVVHVDLRDRTVLRNTALSHDGVDGRTVRLRGVDSYVSVRGVFRMARQGETSTVFLAPYGDPADPEEGPQVRVECNHDGLRDDVIPDGEFSARCLGKVLAWKSAEGELVIRPIAMFQ